MIELLALLGGLSLLAGLIIYEAFSWGFVTLKFYTWFILPIFPFLSPITFYQAVGLFFFFLLMKNRGSKSLKEEYYSESKVVRMIQGIVLPWVILGMALFIRSIIQ